MPHIIVPVGFALTYRETEPDFSAPTFINYENPITVGLGLVSHPVTDHQHILRGINAQHVVTGTRIIRNSGYRNNAYRGYGATYGIGTTDNIATGYASSGSSGQSVFFIANRNGAGGGSVGRIWSKSATDRIWTDASVTRFQSAWSSGTYQGSTALMTTAIKRYCLTYMPTLNTTDPILWTDGVAATMSQTSTPSGSFVGSSGALNIGGGAAGANWDGYIGLLVAWSRILTNDEIESMTENPWQIFMPDEELFYLYSASAAVGGGLSTFINPPLRGNFERGMSGGFQG